MNRDDIIRMAREAGLAWVEGLNGAGYGINTVSDLERFFQAAYAAGAAAATEEANRRANASWSLMCEKMVAAEREACAKVCEELRFSERGPALEAKRQRDLCAMAIRARSATK